ncbi:hypothetical protein DYB25_005511 [Aphanomyces astaci]|uniref:Endonuclease/exonuclease/phosphatase domain-containing protein n=2 Tax=Aphanomyces astaci TaxID=112090 RepID=A0A396ZYU0_APHAT|nr:hypothetical protein DYB25_005511 [Aphanomyces astaci]
MDTWRHIPAMFSQGVQVTSHTVSEHVRSKVVPASSVIDVFASSSTCSLGSTSTCPRPNALAYGNILYHIEPSSKEAAESALVAALAHFRMSRQDVTLEDATVLQLDMTRDGVHPWEVVAYNYVSSGSSSIRVRVNHGVNFHLTFVTSTTRHRAVVHLNTLEHSYVVLEHSHFPAILVSPSAPPPDAPSSSFAEPKIATYNVWNVNPPGVVYGHANRWSMYSRRMDHLVAFVRQVDADIVGLQEVRVDNSFGPVGHHAQIQHIMERLGTAYQYVYRPAMAYPNDQNPMEHVEEGPAILSKHPILTSDYVLLSRVVDDPNDSHHRLCLHAAVDVPHWGVVDVYVTHLSLSERSREQTMVEVWEFMQQGKGVTQVLLGDLNAEPQSHGIQFLQGKVPLHGHTTDLRDAWLHVHHEEPEPKSKDKVHVEHAFTFPSDDPVKRIDFVLSRGQGHAVSCDVFGQAPTADSAHFPKDNGMLSQAQDSPVYASDHRGVVATFRVVAAMGLCVGLAFLSKYLDRLIEQDAAVASKTKGTVAWSSFEK